VRTDVAIVGGGPGASAAAMYLKSSGIESVLVEKVSFPRYHIGESMTAEAGVIVRELGFEQAMMDAGHPVKHGVKVLGSRGSEWFVPVMRRIGDELVDQTTWQVRRSVFDSMMQDEAVARGATLVHGKVTRPLLADDGAVRGLRIRTSEGELDLESEFVLDCSGQSTFLATHEITGPKYLGAYDKQIAIFSQVTGFQRDPGSDTDRTLQPGNTLIYYKGKFLWAWCIPLDDEVMSVGVVSPSQYFLDTKETKEEFLQRELRERHPDLARRAENVEFVEPVHVIPNYSFQVSGFTGKGFICVGDAHRFIDPIFSFGLYVTMAEARLASDAVKAYLEGEGRDSDDPFEQHVLKCERATDVLEDLIDAFWENPLAFAVFVHSRYIEQMVDAFAGRIYEEHGQPSVAVQGFRKLLRRERVYNGDGVYSVPIGSRFDPSRAPLWDSTLDSVETTERWMREELET
jgi:1H-pyrrole-2-carbonyl-[peptidyl-carrier protein] brominase